MGNFRFDRLDRNLARNNKEQLLRAILQDVDRGLEFKIISEEHNKDYQELFGKPLTLHKISEINKNNSF